MKPADFVAACQRLQDLDLSENNAAALDVAVTKAMPPTYALPYQRRGKEVFDRSAGPPAGNRRGQWHELVQHLHDLGYVEDAFVKAWHHRRKEKRMPSQEQLLLVFRGIAAYLPEDDYPLYTQLVPFPAGADVFRQTEWVETHLSIIVFRLAELTSFDGDLRPPARYKVGDTSIYGRSLMFRLRVLFGGGRKELGNKAYFDVSLVGYLGALNASIGSPIEKFREGVTKPFLPLEFWALLSSWDNVFTAFRRRHRFFGQSGKPYLLLYNVKDVAPPEDATEEKRERWRKRMQRRLQKDLVEERSHIDTGENFLGRRLVQVGLWRAGFYTGEIDGRFGLRSHEAMEKMLAQEKEADKPVFKKKKQRKVLVSADGGRNELWAINLRLAGIILDAYKPPSAGEVEAEEAEIWKQLDEHHEGSEWEEDVLNRQGEMKQMYPDQVENPFRRVYYGLRGLLRGAFRAIKRIVAWVARTLKEIAGAVFNFVKAAVKRIREGIGLFYEGFRYFAHYLLGKPFTTLGTVGDDGHAAVLSTRLRLDFDATNYVSSIATPEDIRRHQVELVRMGRGMEFFLKTFGTIVNLITRALSPLGWVRIGIFIAKVVRNLLRAPNETEVVA